jgi:hypothetical protein
VNDEDKGQASEVERWKASAELLRQEVGSTMRMSNEYQQRWLIALTERDQLREDLKAERALTSVLDDEFMRNVAGYGYNVPRIHAAILDWRKECRASLPPRSRPP